MEHKHRAVAARRKTRCFVHCVAPSACRQAAHGNVVIVDECRCGARRETNSNAAHERGPWRKA